MMSKKKSYMNNKNLMSEGFFDKFFKKLKDKKKAKKLKKHSNFMKSFKDLNKNVKDLEDIFSDIYGSKVELEK